MHEKKILIPLPLEDFDPSEVAIPWRIFSEASFDVVFATPTGAKASADRRMLDGNHLGPLKEVLRADENARSAYRLLADDERFASPLRYADIDPSAFQGLHLPGGHAPGMRAYLESDAVQRVVVHFFEHDLPVSAVCHGVVLVARSVDRSGRSVLSGRKSTCLLKTQENLAWNLTRLWLGDYYRTYRESSVEDEVRRALGEDGEFLSGPLPLRRDAPDHLEPGFVCQDGNYLSARWPGDVHSLAHRFVALLRQPRP